MQILVTGGAGYIGSHVVRQLIDAGHKVVIFDNLSRGHKEALHPGAVFEQIDLLDYSTLCSTLEKYTIEAVIHFAAYAYVGESVEQPAMYYQNNLVGSLNLLRALVANNIRSIVFSSTCSVYGNDASIPISELSTPAPINPYAHTKLMIEQFLSDFEGPYGLRSVCLRYFNAAGAAMDGGIGESHSPETHLIPLVLYTAQGKRETINVFGTDYPTSDGTCVRDYIHVEDLADAHIRAVRYLLNGGDSVTVNLGTGKGNSVKQIIEIAEKITQKAIPVTYCDRRAGDPAVLVADTGKAKEVLGWVPVYTIEDIVESAWKWHNNPRY
ncbi:MAG: UDP-glucose 4-epimerase GalE [Ignavibacteria bacterium]|nr:UDP-glucose 4-epimerase GalE [Ignavibacteria bacterium]